MIENSFWKGLKDSLGQFESALVAENSDTYMYENVTLRSIQGFNVVLIFI
jgi:hypothetical protein